MTTDQEYEDALRTIKQYRGERGMDFYLPINIDSAEGTITIEELRRFESLKQVPDGRTWKEWFDIIRKERILLPQRPPSVQEMLLQQSERQLEITKKRLNKL